MRKLFFLFVANLAITTLWAYDFVGLNDHIYYNDFSSNKAEVTYKDTTYNSYSKDVVIPEKTYWYHKNKKYRVERIGAHAFRNCTTLTSITIPNSIKSIELSAFIHCWSLNNVTIPDSVTSIGHYAFHDCIRLNNITIGNSVTSIGQSAFEDCISLNSVTIPNSVTSIGTGAFSGCSSMTNVTLNSNSIVGSSYKEDSNISHIFGSQVTNYVIGDSVTEIGFMSFYGCTNLTSITIPNSVTSIGYQAFLGCSSLDSLTVNGVEFIDYGAFADCSSLTSVTIGNSIYKIDMHAFRHCYNLTTVVCKATDTPEAYSNSFEFSSSATLYVPKASLDKYKSTEPWSRFKQILPIEDNSEDPSNPDDGGDDPFNPDDEETDRAITCEEAVSICQETGTTITTEQYTIHGYVTEIKSAYSEQYNNIIFWMADTPHGGRVLQAYGVKPVEQDDKYVKVGDYVEVIGTLVNYNGNTPEVYKGGTYTIIQADEDPSNPEDNSKDSITVKAKMPAHWTDDISAWIGGATSSGHWVTPTKEGDWYVVTEDVEELNIIFVNGTSWSGDKNQTIDMTFTANACIQLAQEGGDKATYTTVDCEGNDTPKDDDEDDGAITCAEAVSICQETGTTITTEQYTIRGYVTEIKTAYSEQYNNITFWMADIPNGGKVLQAYRVIPVEANDIDVKVGDYVEVIGSLVNYYGTTPEVYMGGTYTIIPKGVSTYINNIKVPTNGSSTIFLRDGQFFILRDGKTYNVMGQEM